MLKCTKIFILLLFAFTEVLAQKHGRDVKDLDYDAETTFGLNFNTNAILIGGVNFRYSKRSETTNFNTFYLELVTINHPKEFLDQNEGGDAFKFGKMNYFFVMRPSYCKEKVLFRKNNDEGIQLNWLYGAGPSIGFISPYYVKYGNDSATFVQFKPTNQQSISQIYTKGGMFYGFTDSDLTMGIHLRSSLLFEYGTYKSNLTGIEIGVVAEAFTKKIPIMAYSNNRSAFFTIFAAIYFGRRS